MQTQLTNPHPKRTKYKPTNLQTQKQKSMINRATNRNVAGPVEPIERNQSNRGDGVDAIVHAASEQLVAGASTSDHLAAGVKKGFESTQQCFSYVLVMCRWCDGNVLAM